MTRAGLEVVEEVCFCGRQSVKFEQFAGSNLSSAIVRSAVATQDLSLLSPTITDTMRAAVLIFFSHVKMTQKALPAADTFASRCLVKLSTLMLRYTAAY
eukprot:scaffold520819_cov20-Prasinocladus_malaysianus.AAC.1